ncbi:pentatricopeptide repeat-containing protein At4g16470-like [Zingiber officinale]|uniref:pentatricopeptide repeat-containing protein At4g16470-like n=1 Tax=Zingiber officinale TaxID=94328 RepID=UPI001C4BFE3E|nr:pentatricopeptide repeat-containing protein At4g16470-like [Zingiber officinale]
MMLNGVTWHAIILVKKKLLIIVNEDNLLDLYLEIRLSKQGQIGNSRKSDERRRALFHRSAASLAAALDRHPAALSLRQIQGRFVRFGLTSDPRLSAHCRAGAVAGAAASTTLLNAIPHRARSLLEYNHLIRDYASSALADLALDLFFEMLDAGFFPNEFTFPFVLKSCALLGLFDLVQQIHADLVKTGLLASNVFCAGALLDVYVKNSSFGDACQLFDRMPHRNEVTWNAMLTACAQNGFLDRCLEMLDTMVESRVEVGIVSWNSIVAGCVRHGDLEFALESLSIMLYFGSFKPNVATFNTLLPLIPTIPSLDRLKELHVLFYRSIVDRIDIDPISADRVWSAIAAGYAFHRCMEYATCLFEKVRLKTCYLWNSMISGFLAYGQIDKASHVFREMALQCGFEAQTLSQVSLTLILPECGRPWKSGLEIHAHAFRSGIESSTAVSNALIAMYAKRGDTFAAEKIFRMIKAKDVVSWNTTVAMYVMVHDVDRAFKLFQQMVTEGVQPDEYSFSSALNACAYSSCLRQGMALHGRMVKSGFCSSCPIVQNSLMDAYGKCGCVEDAQTVFEEVRHKDVISWNTIISCYGFSARPQEAILLFDRMKDEGWKPNRVTYIALLSACNHAGLIDEGLHYFETMVSEHGIVPDVDHYTCIVDSLGKAGLLKKAYQFIKDMPVEPDDYIWGALLSSCRIHGDVQLAEIAAKHLIELDPQHSGYWVLLSNVYADASRWGDVSEVRAAMKGAGVNKCPGFSWVEVGGREVHRFLTADKLHEQCDDIYLALDGLTKQLKDEGYVPLVNPKGPLS